MGQKLFEPLLGKAVEAARHGLEAHSPAYHSNAPSVPPDAPDPPSPLEVYERTLHKSVPPCPKEALQCIASLARTAMAGMEAPAPRTPVLPLALILRTGLGRASQGFIASLVPSMIASGLSIELTAAMLELVRAVPQARDAIEPPLLQLITDALQDRPVSPGRRSTAPQEAADKVSSEARVSTALQALAGFEWKQGMEEFLHESVVPCLDHEDHSVRGNAALALLHVVVVPLKRGRTSELVSKARTPLAALCIPLISTHGRVHWRWWNECS